MDVDALLAQKLGAVLPHLNEQQRRLLLAAEARALGYGGVSRVARAAGLSRPTIHAGLRALLHPPAPGTPIRQPGAGRKKRIDHDPRLSTDLEALIDPTSRGDPQSPLRWTAKSSRQLAAALQAQGHQVSYRLVATLLHDLGYSLQANRKMHEGATHPDRDAQFQYLQAQVQDFLHTQQPVVSVDTKKKELIGPFRNGGREWQPRGRPETVNVYDFPDPDEGKAIPYGVYDVGHAQGWVSVGCDHDSASFAVASLRRWWRAVGPALYPQAHQLLICADSGGSNGSRVRLWKWELQQFANETGVSVTVGHLPPGTSKWNKIEHRLFSRISWNWRGRPLISHEVVVALIGATHTASGQPIQVERDTATYPLHVTVSDHEMAALCLQPHAFHGNWNYTITPAPKHIKL